MPVRQATVGEREGLMSWLAQHGTGLKWLTCVVGLLALLGAIAYPYYADIKTREQEAQKAEERYRAEEERIKLERQRRHAAETEMRKRESDARLETYKAEVSKRHISAWRNRTTVERYLKNMAERRAKFEELHRGVLALAWGDSHNANLAIGSLEVFSKYLPNQFRHPDVLAEFEAGCDMISPQLNLGNAALYSRVAGIRKKLNREDIAQDLSNVSRYLKLVEAGLQECERQLPTLRVKEDIVNDAYEKAWGKKRQ